MTGSAVVGLLVLLWLTVGNIAVWRVAYRRAGGWDANATVRNLNRATANVTVAIANVVVVLVVHVIGVAA